MSYDIYLEADLGGPEPVELEMVHWNYTSNVVPMWLEAMPDTHGLAGLDGMNAGAAASALRDGIAAMEADPDTYRALNPANGWGSFDSQLLSLKALLDACVSAPHAIVRVSR